MSHAGGAYLKMRPANLQSKSSCNTRPSFSPRWDLLCATACLKASTRACPLCVRRVSSTGRSTAWLPLRCSSLVRMNKNWKMRGEQDPGSWNTSTSSSSPSSPPSPPSEISCQPRRWTSCTELAVAVLSPSRATAALPTTAS